MPNPHSITVNPETELGICVSAIINETPYGKSTYLMKLFMDKHKTEMILYWDKKGLKGSELFEKYYSKWSMTAIKQQEENRKKESIEIEQKKQAYISMGHPEAKATLYASMKKEAIEEVLAVTKAVKPEKTVDQNSKKLRVDMMEEIADSDIPLKNCKNCAGCNAQELNIPCETMWRPKLT